VTPKVIENPQEIREITEELRSRMARASEYEESVKGDSSSP